MLREALKNVLSNLCRGRIQFLTPSAETAAISPESESGEGYPLHKHGYAEMVHLIEGRAKLDTAESPWILSSDAPCLILPETIHAERYIRPQSGYLLLWFIFGPGGFNIFSSSYARTEGFRIPTEKILGLTRNVKSLWNLTSNPALAHNALLQAEFQAQAIQSLLEAIHRLDTPSSNQLDHRRILVNQIREYVECHYHEMISVSDLASMARCTPNYLNGIFRNIVGQPIHQFILQCRLDAAREELAKPDSSVKETAYKLGFNDPLYFSRLFKKKFGFAPSEWRI
jgi:AraC-like DNA-binding protein